MDEKNREKYHKQIKEIYRKSGMKFTKKELDNMEITDFGLNDFFNIGLSIIIYVNSERVCAKELAMTANQICPQHKHPKIGDNQGKEETFRCRKGEVYLYVEGIGDKELKGRIPEKYKDKFNVFHEKILKQGDQYTIKPDTWHWFQAGPKGAVISEFSTHSCDVGDIFYDENILRISVDN